MVKQKQYEVAIVGGGIVGSALLYTLSNYTNVKSIALIEKHSSPASLNSNSTSNSQTLHFGDVETNYTKEKAGQTSSAARLILGYSSRFGLFKKGAISRCQKLLLAVGENEISYAENWYESFAKHMFKGLREISSKELSKLEPNVVRGRPYEEKISAYLSDTGYMADFGTISHSFINNAMHSKKAEIKLNMEINSISEEGDGYKLSDGETEIHCRFVVFAAGPYSLYFAKSLGIAENLSIIATGGGFFISKKVLNGKVYRVQKGKIPFAAVHGDPDINNGAVTRFGPVIYLPLGMEKGALQISDYATTSGKLKFLSVSADILGKYNLYGLMSRNMLYSVPILGKELFLRNEATRIVPSLKYGDLSAASGYGGISPRIVDLKKHVLNIGEEKIRKGGAIFNISPSPGASSSLAIAESDAKYICNYLGKEFHEDRFNKELSKS